MYIYIILSRFSYLVSYHHRRSFLRVITIHIRTYFFPLPFLSRSSLDRGRHWEIAIDVLSDSIIARSSLVPSFFFFFFIPLISRSTNFSFLSFFFFPFHRKKKKKNTPTRLAQICVFVVEHIYTVGSWMICLWKETRIFLRLCHFCSPTPFKNVPLRHRLFLFFSPILLSCHWHFGWPWWSCCKLEGEWWFFCSSERRERERKR